MTDKPLPTFTTPGFTLTPATVRDADAWFAFEMRCAAVPGAMQFIPRPTPQDVGEVRERIARSEGGFCRERTIFPWVIRLAGDDAVVGYVAFVRWDHEHRRAEVAYVVAPSCWGRGLAVEATARILEFAWKETDLHRAEARIDPGNTASIRAAEKLGFLHEGTLRESVWSGGRCFDTAVYAKLRPRLGRAGQG